LTPLNLQQACNPVLELLGKQLGLPVPTWEQPQHCRQRAHHKASELVMRVEVQLVASLVVWFLVGRNNTWCELHPPKQLRQQGKQEVRVKGLWAQQGRRQQRLVTLKLNHTLTLWPHPSTFTLE